MLTDFDPDTYMRKPALCIFENKDAGQLCGNCEADQRLFSLHILLIPKYQGSKCPSLPGLTHWVNPGLPGLGFKPYFGKVGNTGE